MKNSIAVFILLLMAQFPLFSNHKIDLLNNNASSFISEMRVINNLDSVIFDLTNATLTATYIDVPVSIKSDDLILGIDFAMQFNLAKLTYSTTINLLTGDPTISSLAYFNPNDLYLRYTCASLQSIPANGTTIMIIRFAVTAPCSNITIADFTNLSAMLNGPQCSYRVSNLIFSQFVPIANFTAKPPCINTTVIFTDSSKVLKGTITCWHWNLGNGNTSTLQNNVLTFTNVSTFSSTLIATASSGCSDTIVKSVQIGEPPVAGFTYTFDCVKDTVFFTNTSTINSGTIANSLWYFGDQSTAITASNPAYHYTGSGSFKVKLTTTSNLGCSSNTTNTVRLRASDLNKNGVTNVDDFLLFVPYYNTNCN